MKADRDVTGFRIYQSETGHHATLYMAREEKPPGTAECVEDDMFNVSFLAGGGTDAPEIIVPDGLAFRLPADKQLMIQTHWLRHAGAPLRARREARIEFPTEMCLAFGFYYPGHGEYVRERDLASVNRKRQGGS